MKIHARIETARAAYVVSESFQARGKNIWGDWVTLRIVRMPAGAVYEHTQSPSVSVLRAETVDARFQGPRAGYTKALTLSALIFGMQISNDDRAYVFRSPSSVKGSTEYGQPFIKR